MSRLVCKFGGSSLSNSAQFKKVKSIIDSDPRRSIIVPSAPGKSSPDETKITDLLYQSHKAVQDKSDLSTPFSKIEAKYLSIESDLGLRCGMADHLEKLKEQIKNGATVDFTASRGEYLCGLLVAAYLDADFVDPALFIQIDRSGRIHPDSYKILGKRLSDAKKRFVIPGFYGADKTGEVLTFSRGGSDISGAIAARAAGAEIYENWTDVSGLLMTDPRIVKDARVMKKVTYREIRELAYMGANVFHDEAIAPVRDADIPINIRNTNRPEDSGTLIVARHKGKSGGIAGIAGKKNVSIFNIEKTMMNKERGFGRKVLEVFENHGVSFEHAPTGIDSMNVVVLHDELKDKSDAICSDIRKELQPDKLEVHHDISLISTVGEDMEHAVGTAARLFTALSEASINVAIIDQGFSEINIIIGVFKKDYEKAVQTLYRAFVE